MYGGSGTSPCTSSQSVTDGTSTRRWKKRSARPTTSASTPPGSRSRPPIFGGWLARSWNSAVSAPVTRSSRSSTRPPVDLVAATRDLITRVSLNTMRSPARTSEGRSVNARSRRRPPSTCSRRLPVRSADGAWATSSGGRSKSKSRGVNGARGRVVGHGRVGTRACGRSGDTVPATPVAAAFVDSPPRPMPEWKTRSQRASRPRIGRRLEQSRAIMSRGPTCGVRGGKRAARVAGMGYLCVAVIRWAQFAVAVLRSPSPEL